MLQNIPKDKILDVVRLGPTFPSKIAKALGGGGDTMLIGAILSTLISSGDLKVSTIKVGGSPLYYVPEQESKLEDFLSYLNEKDKQAFRLLKEEKILQDSLQDPLTRVSLRTIKDFAKSFEIDFNKQKVLFWRFYSLPKEEALLLAKAYIKTSSESIVEKVTAEKVVVENIEKEAELQSVETKQSIIQESTLAMHNTNQHSPEAHESAQTVLDSVGNVAVPESTHSTETHKEKHTHATHEHKPHHEHIEHKEHAVHSEHAPHHTKSPAPKKSTQDFFEIIQKYVLSKNLDIISKEKLKKTEYDLVLKNHETNEYIYCKAKDKSSINEGDLAPALIFAQNKKMPCLFISTGDLTKSAEVTLVNQFKGMAFEKIKATNTDSI